MVTTTKLRTKLTYEDYLNTPDDERYELIDGELIMSPSPRMAHQEADMEIGSILHTFVKLRNLGKVYSAPFDVVLSDTDVVQPDLLFVSRERLHIITENNIQGAPDLAVEILSPSTSARSRLQARSVRQARRQRVLAGGHRRQAHNRAVSERRRRIRRRSRVRRWTDARIAPAARLRAEP